MAAQSLSFATDSSGYLSFSESSTISDRTRKGAGLGQTFRHLPVLQPPASSATHPPIGAVLTVEGCAVPFVVWSDAAPPGLSEAPTI